MATIKDIAKAADVSYSTVSYVLGNRKDTGRISEKTRKLVTETACRLGYRKNRLASATRSGRIATVAVIGEIVNDSFSGNVATVLPGIMQAASESDLSTQIFPDTKLEEKVEHILELKINQLICIVADNEKRRKIAELARKNNIKLVFIYERGIDGYPAVSTDDCQGVRIAVKHLTSLGHRRIGLICGSHNFSYLRERHNGYLEGLADARIVPDEDLIIHCDQLEADIIDPPIEKLLQMPQGKRPSAFCCTGGLHANAIMRVASKLKINVPEELSIVTFGNSMGIEYGIIPFTTIAQPLEKLGKIAFDLLQEVKLPFSPDAHGDYLLAPKLIERKSCAPLPK